MEGGGTGKASTVGKEEKKKEMKTSKNASRQASELTKNQASRARYKAVYQPGENACKYIKMTASEKAINMEGGS